MDITFQYVNCISKHGEAVDAASYRHPKHRQKLGAISEIMNNISLGVLKVLPQLCGSPAHTVVLRVAGRTIRLSVETQQILGRTSHNCQIDIPLSKKDEEKSVLDSKVSIERDAEDKASIERDTEERDMEDNRIESSLEAIVEQLRWVQLIPKLFSAAVDPNVNLNILELLADDIASFADNAKTSEKIFFPDTKEIIEAYSTPSMWAAGRPEKHTTFLQPKEGYEELSPTTQAILLQAVGKLNNERLGPPDFPRYKPVGAIADDDTMIFWVVRQQQQPSGQYRTQKSLPTTLKGSLIEFEGGFNGRKVLELVAGARCLSAVDTEEE